MVDSEREQRTYGFDERVGLLAQAFDDIRYEDGVEYEHRDMARQLAEVEEGFDDIHRALEENHEKWEVSQELFDVFVDTAEEKIDDYNDSELGEKARQYIEHERKRMEEHKKLLLEEKGLWDKYQDIRDRFEEIKYNGYSESGPGEFAIAVKGPASEYMKHVDGMDGTEWGSIGRDPRVDDPDLAQLIYDTLGNHSNDGAIVMAEDAESGRETFLPETVWVPDAQVSQNAYLKEGGTKHRAAVNAVYGDVRDESGDESGEEMVRASLVLSETDGKIREFRRGDYLGDVAEEQLYPLFDGDDVDVTQLRFEAVREDGTEEIRLYREEDGVDDADLSYITVEDVYPDYAGEAPDDLVLRKTDDGIDLWEQEITTFNYDAGDKPRVPSYWEEDSSYTDMPESVADMFTYWDGETPENGPAEQYVDPVDQPMPQ